MNSFVCIRLIILCCFILGSKLLITDAQPCVDPVEWVGVEEVEYERTLASLRNQTGRPLGFDHGTIPFGTGRTDPCITISGGINGRRIEVMAESNPTGKVVCVSRDGLETQCQDSGIYMCEQTNADTVSYVFHCTQSCEESDVPILFRFTVSPDATDPELWCDARNSGEYPKTLIPSPQGFTIAPVPKTTKAGVSTITLNSTLLMVLGCILWLL